MTHLYYQKRNTDDGPLLVLVFSDHPLAARALDDHQRLTELSRKRAFLGLYVELSDDGAVHQTNLYHDDGNFSGPWTFEPAKGKSANTAGKIAMEEEREFFGKPYFVDVSFKLNGKAEGTWRGSAFYEAKPTGLAVGQARGWIEREGKKTKLSHAIVVTEADLFGDTGERKLFLSDGPVTNEMLNGAMGPESGMRQAGVEFMRVGIDGKDEIESVMVMSDEGNPVNFTSTHWTIELAKSVPSQLDGYVELEDASTEDSQFPRFNVKFCAAIKKIGPAGPVTADTGKPLPKDGGEAGKVYLEFGKKLKKAKSIEELLPYRIAALNRQFDEIPAEQRGGLLEFLKGQQTSFKIVGGYANEAQATLWLEGKQDDVKVEGRVNVHLENGVWKLGMEAYRSRM